MNRREGTKVKYRTRRGEIKYKEKKTRKIGKKDDEEYSKHTRKRKASAEKMWNKGGQRQERHQLVLSPRPGRRRLQLSTFSERQKLGGGRALFAGGSPAASSRTLGILTPSGAGAGQGHSGGDYRARKSITRGTCEGTEGYTYPGERLQRTSEEDTIIHNHNLSKWRGNLRISLR